MDDVACINNPYEVFEMEASDDDLENQICDSDLLTGKFTPRTYQEELFEFAKEKNSILVLGTGSGKTFISILLIKELGESIRGSVVDGAKRTLFIVNTVPLVHQQSAAIEQHTPFKVGRFEGAMGVDIWSEEKWKEEINKYEVLVMVAQIFLDLLIHNRLPIVNVNLIIMDECHHATGYHPMREIMREYNKIKDSGLQVPHILGMTACVIAKRCKESEVLKLMKNLEVVMDGVLVTSQDQETVSRFSTCASEMIVKCPVRVMPAKYETVLKQLEIVHQEVRQLIDGMNSYRDYYKAKAKKITSKMVNGIMDIADDIGYFILPKAIKLQAEYLVLVEADTEIELLALNALGEKLKNLVENCAYLEGAVTEEYLSGKVLRLLEILRQKSCKDKCILVFVTRRNTAKLMATLINEVKLTDPHLSHLNPESVVGGLFNIKMDLKVCREEIRKQNETIRRFRKGECNIIIATSVLEEGIDIRKCNLVIRYDAPSNYRSYIQSLGRARAVPSYYIIFEYEKGDDGVETDLQVYKKIHRSLSVLCHDRVLPTLLESNVNFSEDMPEDPYVPYGFPGPQVTFNSAIALINRYCGTLPHDKFTTLSVSVKSREVIVNEERLYIVDLNLPVSAPFRECISGNAMKNGDEAKKSAALKLAKKLHELGHLDSNLLPVRNNVSAKEAVLKYICIPEENTGKGNPKPGTRKRRQVYEKQVCKYFLKKKSEFHLHKVHFEQVKSLEKGSVFDTDKTDTHIGLLCDSHLRCCSFPLYSKKWGIMLISIEYIREVNYETVSFAKDFHDKMYRCLLSLDKENMMFTRDKAEHSVFIVPLSRGCEIDIGILDRVKGFNFEEECKCVNKKFVFNAERYQNAAILPSYRKREMYSVHFINYDENPLSSFPENKKLFTSYSDYVQKEYGLKVLNESQPLLDCKHFSKEFNYLKLLEAFPTSRTNQHPNFIPELCVVFPISASLWNQILCVPSILHRINGLMLEQELFSSVDFCTHLGNMNKFLNYMLNYQWANEEVKKLTSAGRSDVDNICIKLRNKTDMSVWPGMILQALTPLHINDNFNLERLEILGDSYLKFSVGVYLFCKELLSHEGSLTLQRSDIVSNKTLYHLGKDKGIGNLYQGSSLTPFTAFPYGFEVEDNTGIRCKKSRLEEMDESPLPEIAVDDDLYRPWKDQVVPDKCVADSVEALTGVYLLCGGEAGANNFLSWLGMTFIREVVNFPATGFLKEDIVDFDLRTSLKTINRLYKKYCLDRLEDILGYTFRERSLLVQAVTHPSYVINRVTDCYQRLEFLGDAILDYMISCYIFTTFENYDPGQLTDIRSHLVKNETLAKVSVQFGLHKYLLHMSHMLNSYIDNFITLLLDGEREFTCEDDTFQAQDVEVPKALGDIVEALIGAVYIDSGKSLQVTWKVIVLLLKDEFEATKTEIPIDNVRALYERDAAVVMQISPPTEDQPAKCIVKMKGYPEFTGTGKNRRTAKQAAAKLALYHINKFPRRPQ